MTLPEVYSDLLKVFGMPNPANAPDMAREIILNEINAALQMMQQGGEDFFAREPLEVTLVAEQQDYDLDATVQTVLDPALLSDGTLLSLLTTFGQFLRFGQLFLGQLDNNVASGKPSAIFVESTRNDTEDEEDELVKITVRLVPKPDASAADDYSLKLDVIKEPGVITDDVLDVPGEEEPPTPAPVLPIAHKYVESIFLPIARFNLTHSFLFYDKEKLPQYRSDYERALRLLGLADPRRPKPPESRDEALHEPQAAAPAGAPR